MNFTQIMAIAIFVAMFALIITEVIERHQATILAALAMIMIVFLLCMHSTGTVWKILSVGDLVRGSFWLAAGEGASSDRKSVV